MDIPPYLSDILAEASEYYESEEALSHTDVAHEVAHQYDSVIRSGEGKRGPLDVLVDIQRIHTLCADELRTYRKARTGDYTQSVIEAIALRSLEELINDHLSDSSSLDSGLSEINREIAYRGEDDDRVDTKMFLHLTAKEAADVDAALRDLAATLKENDDPRAGEVHQYAFDWKAGITGLQAVSVPLRTPSEVTILLEALTRYEPQRADFTARVRHAVLAAIATPRSPIDPEAVESFEGLIDDSSPQEE